MPIFLRFPRLLAIAALGLAAAAAPGQPAITVTLDPRTPGPAIPADFSGLSFEMQQVLPDAAGRHYFRASNRPLIALFRTLGVRSLRVGGNTADTPTVPIPAPADLDDLFAFARAAGVKVIFTLRLRQGDPTAAASVAKYLMDRYPSEITCFAIGNEPNVYDRTYEAYRADLRKYLAVITAPGIAPTAVFCGPSTTPGKAVWARQLADDAAAIGPIVLITQHEYPGGAARNAADAPPARDRMLSAAWLRGYEKDYQAFVPAADAHGLPYRLEEANSFFNGGAKDVSDTFAAALWALDYLHWWAAHGAAGLNFHTGDQVAAADSLRPCRYAAFWTAPDGYAVHPIGYALKAFALGGTGRRLAVNLASPAGGPNLTAYAILAADGGISVTLINKEHGAAGRAADIALSVGPGFRRGQAIYLTAPHGDIASTSGLLLGGSAIADDGSWNGTWTDLPASADGSFSVALPAATAAVVRLMAK